MSGGRPHRMALLIFLVCLIASPATATEADGLAIMLAVAGAFVIGSRVFTPALDRHRDDADRSRFAAIHRLSVIVHLAQLAAVAVVLVRLAE